MKTNIQDTKDESIKKLAAIIKDIKFSMVTTTTADHQLHSCPLTTQQVEFDGDLWFIVGKNSEVVANISASPQVNASFSSEKGNYVSVAGFATIEEDKKKLQELWSEAYKIWFSQGINDPNIALLKIHVEEAEYWESPSLKVVKLMAFAKAYITGDKSGLGEHHKVNLN